MPGPHSRTRIVRNWDLMSYKEKLIDMRTQFALSLGRLKKRPKGSNVEDELKQLTYYIWLPVHNSLHPDESWEEKKVEQNCSGILFRWIDKHVPKTRNAAMNVLYKKYRRLNELIRAEERKESNELRRKLGLSRATEPTAAALFEEIFKDELEETSTRKPVL